MGVGLVVLGHLMARRADAREFDLRLGHRAGPLRISVCGLAPAISCANNSMSRACFGSAVIGMLKPWRQAFLLARALPCAVFGPLLARPLLRLASRLLSEIFIERPR